MEEIIETFGKRLIEASDNLKNDDLEDVILPLQMYLKTNLRKLPNNNIKISLFLLESLIAKIMSSIIEKTLFGGKRDEDKEKDYKSFFIENFKHIGDALVSRDENKVFDEAKAAVLAAGEKELIKI